jgi:hypothetical protein
MTRANVAQMLRSMDDENERIDQLRKRAADHGIGPGSTVIQMERVVGAASVRRLYRYGTALSFDCDYWRSLGWTVNTTEIAWDGITDINWCAGD